MDMDYLGTPATSTPSESYNSTARRKIKSTRQSLSSSFVHMTMCVRYWTRASILNVSLNRQAAVSEASPSQRTDPSEDEMTVVYE